MSTDQPSTSTDAIIPQHQQTQSSQPQQETTQLSPTNPPTQPPPDPSNGALDIPPEETTVDDPEIDSALNPDITMNLDGTSDIPAPISAALPNGDNDPAAGMHHPAVIEPRIPQKKDASLRDFLSKMDDYAPLIPDAVTDYYLTVAGLPPPPETDRRLARLLALATQKFIADVAADAYQYSRIRSTNTTSNNPLTGLGGAAGVAAMGMPAAGEGEGGGGGGGGGGKGKKEAGKNQPLGGPRAGYGGGGAGGAGQGRTVLTMEDLGMAVGEYGVNVRRGEFYR